MTNKSNKIAGIVMGLAVLCLLGLGVLHLFNLRFSAGDIYPSYSSFRADPMGTKALFESLQEYQGLTISRNFKGPDEIEEWPKGTMLFLGDSYDGRELFSVKIAKEFDEYMLNGGRVVFTLDPSNVSSERSEESKKRLKKREENKKKWRRQRKGGKDEKKEADEDEVGEDEEECCSCGEKDCKDPSSADKDKKSKWVRARDWFGVDVHHTSFTGDVFAVKYANPQSNNLPLMVSCHTTLAFSNLMSKVEQSETNSVPGLVERDWNVIYELNGEALVIESRVGNGSLVLSALSYFISNEALRDERHPALISWLIGGNSTVVFDEFHHGIVKKPGISSLLIKYRMHWFVGTLLLLAWLFVWRSTISIVPPSEDRYIDELKELSRGRGSDAGLVNLLRENLSSSQILKTCVEEWERSVTVRSTLFEEKLDRVKEALRQHGGSRKANAEIVDRYNEVSEIIKNKRGGSK